MLKIFKYIEKHEWGFIAISLGLIIIQVWLDLKLPDYMSNITTLVQTEGSTVSDIVFEGGWMLLCALGSLVSSCIVGYFAAKVAAGLAKRLRGEVYDKTLSFSMEEMNDFSTSSLINRTTNDITQVQQLVAMGLQSIIKAPILAVWAILKIAGKSWQWTATTAGAVVVLLVMLSVIIIFVIPKFKIIQQLTDNLNQVTRENLTGLRVVRAYNAEDYQEDKFEEANDELTNTNLFTNRMMSIMQPGMSLIMSGLSLVIYWLGAYLINEAAMMDKISLFSDMIVFSSYAVQVIMAFMLLTMIFIMLPRASVSAGRILEVIERETNIKDGTYDLETSGVSGELEFKNVSFKYPGASDYVLHNVNFKVESGETVAFIGATGSGKSTLINLIPRFYDVSEGEVLVDGINVKEYKLETLHSKIGYVSQKATIFSGTVESNVDYGENGKDDSEEEVGKAIEIAQAEEFVDSLDGGYQAQIAQSGANLSGGQKQRLSIARAVYRDPEIYIFDDSFSALDYKTDRDLRKALNDEGSGATSIVVAQRIGTIKDADKIIVLDDGEVVGIGKHRELLRTCEVYQEIASSQLSQEELSYA